MKIACREWGFDLTKWLIKRSGAGDWRVYAPTAFSHFMPVHAFDSWSAAMAFILATDTRKAA